MKKILLKNLELSCIADVTWDICKQIYALLFLPNSIMSMQSVTGEAIAEYEIRFIIFKHSLMFGIMENIDFRLLSNLLIQKTRLSGGLL